MCENLKTIAQFFGKKFFVKFLDGGKNFQILFFSNGPNVSLKGLGTIYPFNFFHNLILL